MGRYSAGGESWDGVRRRAAVWLAAGMVLVATQAARAEGLKDVSGDGFRADVARLQAVVAQCAVAANGCESDAVGDDVRVGVVKSGGYEEHWGWLRGALKEAKSAKAEERARLMREAQAQLTSMAAESAASGNDAEFARERAAANAVLAEPQFQGAVGLTWWDRAKMKMWHWLQQMFEGIQDVGAAAPWLGTALEWTFFVGAAVGLLFLLLRNVARQRLKVALGGEGLREAAWKNESDEWAEWAREHAEAREWREAVHCLYWAAIVLLESRRAWRHNPTRTPREYVRLLKAGSAQQAGLRGLTQIFERVWYGLREADEREYAEARGLYEGLAGQAEGAKDGGGALSVEGAA
jgi:hypothetical protein